MNDELPINPEIIIEQSPDSNGDVIINQVAEKKKRERKPWVYKSDYDALKRMYNMILWLAALGWFCFGLMLIEKLVTA